jgi:hypothetical protein
MESSDESKKNFVKYVFNFNDNTKAELMNIIQFSLLSLIPLVSLNKLISKYIPDADDSKGSIEIIAEIIIQILVMFLGFFYINRIICFIPTYSGEEYPQNHIIYTVLAVLMIILSINSRLGEKANIIIDRIIELWEGKPSKNGKDKSKVRVSQPIAGKLPPTMPPAHTRNVALSNSFSDGTAINSLPSSNITNQNSQNMMASQQLPDYNNFYEKEDTPLVNAASPAEGFDGGPMAANAVLGGGFGSSW